MSEGQEGLECLECATCGAILGPRSSGILKIGGLLYHAKCCEVVVNFHGKRVLLSDRGPLTRVEITFPSKLPVMRKRAETFIHPPEPHQVMRKAKKCVRSRKPSVKEVSEGKTGDYGLNKDIDEKFSRLGDLI